MVVVPNRELINSAPVGLMEDGFENSKEWTGSRSGWDGVFLAGGPRGSPGTE